MATRKATTPPKPAKKKPTLKQLYAKLKKEFSAADLQKYTEVEKGIPFEQVVAEVDAIHRAANEKLAKRKSR